MKAKYEANNKGLKVIIKSENDLVMFEGYCLIWDTPDIKYNIFPFGCLDGCRERTLEEDLVVKDFFNSKSCTVGF